MNIKVFLIGMLAVCLLPFQTEAQKPDWSKMPLIWDVCQDCGMINPAKTIREAIERARPGDTINIWGEEESRGLGEIYEYAESIIIDKPLTLTCHNPNPVLGRPVITQTFGGDPSRAVITIMPGGEGTVISNLEIRGPRSGGVTDCVSVNPVDCMRERVGIRIKADNCRIENCRITRCMTGILIDGSGNTVVDCLLGDRFYGVVNQEWHIREEWSGSIQGAPIDHPANGFGIVVEGQKKSKSANKVPLPNRFHDNIFRAARYTSVVDLQKN